jgi:hypothetical protein
MPLLEFGRFLNKFVIKQPIHGPLQTKLVSHIWLLLVVVVVEGRTMEAAVVVPVVIVHLLQANHLVEVPLPKVHS